LPVSGLLMFIVNLEIIVKTGLELFGMCKGEERKIRCAPGGDSE
jgi:hypothetical protein